MDHVKQSQQRGGENVAELWGQDYKVLPHIYPSNRSIIDIDYQKECDCQDNHLNCLTAKEWVKRMPSVQEFQFEKRDIRDRLVHPATFPISLATWGITLFTHRGELVVDPFAGVGTTLLSARDTRRNAIGIELQQKYADITSGRLEDGNILREMQCMVVDDARHAAEYFADESISLILTSPPYADALNKPMGSKSYRHREQQETTGVNINYSSDEKDLGTLRPEYWSYAISDIFHNLREKVKSGGNVIVDIFDEAKDGKKYPLSKYVIDSMESAGYEYRNCIIWDKRKLFSSLGIFGWPNNYLTVGTFNYLLHFRRK